jgi:hypothetical protein
MLDVEHLAWAIDQRAKIQHTLLALFEYVRDAPPDDPWSEKEEAIDDLIAVAFSLWRAVFLTEQPRTDQSRREAQRQFLATVISTNAITFGDDRRNSPWSLGFYLANAQQRVSHAAVMIDHIERGAGQRAINHLVLNKGHTSQLIRDDWEGLHAALRTCFNVLRPDKPLPVDPSPLNRMTDSV